MKAHDEGELFGRLAQQYLERYGAGLQRELGALPMIGVDEKRSLNALDARVKREVGRIRTRRVMTGAGAVAAALIVFFMVLPMLRSTGITAAPELSLEAPAAEAAPQEVLGSGSAPPAEAAAPAPAPAESPEEIAGEASVFEPIPIGFALGDNFYVEETMQDREKTVYRLKEAYMDDVVLTLEYGGMDEELLFGLDEIEIGSGRAYGAYGTDYSLLVLERDGLLYTMTCKYDLNTLIGLGRAILI